MLSWIFGFLFFIHQEEVFVVSILLIVIRNSNEARGYKSCDFSFNSYSRRKFAFTEKKVSSVSTVKVYFQASDYSS
jgi:hypothetical protein